jgi:methylated-DNA-protein-cysteine methyltransferase-like protein
MDGPSGWDAYYRVVRRIPRGKVATYAQVALLAGRPRAARHVGFALAALRGSSHRVPWQRVLGKRSARWAGISLLDPMGAAAQRDLLEREGVVLDERDRVSLDRFGWRPRRRRAPTAPSPASRARSGPRTPGCSGPTRSGPSARR